MPTFSESKESIKKQLISITNYSAGYTQTDVDNFVNWIDTLADEAENKAKGSEMSADSSLSNINKSFAEFTRNLSTKLSEETQNILENDKNTAERNASLQKFAEVLGRTRQEYTTWGDNQHALVPSKLPGKDIIDSIVNNLEMIGDEQKKLTDYDNQRRWNLKALAFHRNYKDRVTGSTVQNAQKNAEEFSKAIAQYVQECGPYKAVSDESVRSLNEMARAADEYRSVLNKLDLGIKSEKASKDKFDVIRKATAAGRRMERHMNSLLKIDLPFGFRDRILQFAKGTESGEGLFQGLDNLANDGNDLIDLLDNGAKPESGFKYDSLPEPNPENLKNTAFTWKDETISKIPGLKYAQTDHDDFADIIKQMDELHEKLQKNSAYKNTLDPEVGTEDFFTARTVYDQSRKQLTPLDKDELGKSNGNTYAAKIKERLDTLVSTSMLASQYMTAIANTTYDLNKADASANKEICSALGQLGEKLQQYRGVISKDVELLDSMKLKTEIYFRDIDDAKTVTEYSELLKNVYDRRRNEEKEAAEKAKIDEERARIKAEEEQKREEERLRQEEEEERRRQAEEKREAELEAARREEQRRQEEEAANEARETAENKAAEERRREEILREEQREAEIKDMYEGYRKVCFSDENTNAFNFNMSPTSVFGKRTLLREYFNTVNNLKMYLENMENPLSKEILGDIERIGKIRNPYDIAYRQGSDLDRIKLELENHSSDLQRFMGLKDVVKKFYRLCNELEDKEIRWTESHGESKGHEKLFGFEKIEGEAISDVFDIIGRNLIEYYHKAAEDGRTLYEKTKAVDKHGIGNIEVFRNEDDSIDRLFDYSSQNKQANEHGITGVNEAAENSMSVNDNMVIDTSKKKEADEPHTVLVTDSNGHRHREPEKTEDFGMTQATIAQQKRKILQCSKLLEKSKTFINSNEYRDLIALTRDIGNGTAKTPQGLSPKESFAYELYALHIATERYLDHKAKDGVKKNVFQKLSAVEKTNEVLKSSLDLIGSTELVMNRGDMSKPQSTADLVVSFEDRREQAYRNMIVLKKNEIPEPKENYQSESAKYMNKHPEVPKNYAGAIESGIRSADICMCEIIMKAQQNMDPVAVSNLKNMRDALLEDPFPPVKEDAEPAIQNNSAEKKNDEIIIG